MFFSCCFFFFFFSRTRLSSVRYHFLTSCLLKARSADNFSLFRSFSTSCRFSMPVQLGLSVGASSQVCMCHPVLHFPWHAFHLNYRFLVGQACLNCIRFQEHFRMASVLAINPLRSSALIKSRTAQPLSTRQKFEQIWHGNTSYFACAGKWKSRPYSQVFHVLCLDGKALPCLALVD